MQYFVDFLAYEEQCRFKDCLHLKEPGCAVKKAVDSGKINANYENGTLVLTLPKKEEQKTKEIKINVA